MKRYLGILLVILLVGCGKPNLYRISGNWSFETTLTYYVADSNSSGDLFDCFNSKCYYFLKSEKVNYNGTITRLKNVLYITYLHNKTESVNVWYEDGWDNFFLMKALDHNVFPRDYYSGTINNEKMELIIGYGAEMLFPSFIPQINTDTIVYVAIKGYKNI